MNRFSDFVVEPTLWFLADWSIRWGVLIGVLAVWLLVFRPRKTATRYLVCWGVMLGGLCLPLVPRWGPGIPLAGFQLKERAVDASVEPVESSHPEIPHDDQTLLYQPGAPATDVGTDLSLALGAGDARVPRRSVNSAPDISPLAETLGTRRVILLSVAGLWLGGLAIYLLRWAAGCWLLGRLRRTAAPISGRPAAIFADCANELGVRRPIGFVTHPRVRSPLSLGLFQPVVIVPSDWASQSEHVQRNPVG